MLRFKSIAHQLLAGIIIFGGVFATEDASAGDAYQYQVAISTNDTDDIRLHHFVWQIDEATGTILDEYVHVEYCWPHLGLRTVEVDGDSFSYSCSISGSQGTWHGTNPAGSAVDEIRLSSGASISYEFPSIGEVMSVRWGVTPTSGVASPHSATTVGAYHHGGSGTATMSVRDPLSVEEAAYVLHTNGANGYHLMRSFGTSFPSDSMDTYDNGWFNGRLTAITPTACSGSCWTYYQDASLYSYADPEPTGYLGHYAGLDTVTVQNTGANLYFGDFSIRSGLIE